MPPPILGTALRFEIVGVSVFSTEAEAGVEGVPADGMTMFLPPQAIDKGEKTVGTKARMITEYDFFSIISP